MTITPSQPTLLALWIALILAVPSTTNAQSDSAVVTGTARSSVNGQPLAGVMIAVGGTKAFDVTDSTGTFALLGLPPGKQIIRVLYRDDVVAEHPFTLKQGKTLQIHVLLDAEAVELAPIVVQARSVRSLRSLAGFYERRTRGFGRFYTFEELERRGPLPMRALLNESGIEVRCRMGSCVPVIPRGGRLCMPPVYLDGWLLSSRELESWRADDLAGVEIYRGAINVPWDFRRGLGHDCGAIVMWSKS